jgi:hypothetical protein
MERLEEIKFNYHSTSKKLMMVLFDVEVKEKIFLKAGCSA